MEMFILVSKITFISLTLLILFCLLRKPQYKVYIKDNHFRYLTLFLFIITIITTLYKFTHIPAGINVDEAGMAYDAWSIVNYGVDRYLYPFPVYFINYGGGQNSLYGYCLAFLIKFFGLSVYTLRLPSFIFRIISFLALYHALKSNKLKCLFTLFLFSICPIFIMYSRWGLESYLMIGMITLAFSLTIQAINTRKQYLYVISGIVIGLSLYSYAISYITVPIILILLLLYLIYNKRITIKEFISVLIPVVILAVPLILVLLVNNGVINEIVSFISIPKFISYRGSELSLSNIINNLPYFYNLLTNDALPMSEYNSLPVFFTMYFLSIPLVVLGCILTFKDVIVAKFKDVDIDYFIAIWFVASSISMLLIKDPNINKANAIYIPFLYFIVKSILFLIKRIKYILVIIVLLYSYNFYNFYSYYINDYNEVTKLNYVFATSYLEAMEKAFTLDKNIIYSSKETAEGYIYYNLLCEVEPSKFSTNIINCDKYDKIIYYIDDISINYNAAYITHVTWAETFDMFDNDKYVLKYEVFSDKAVSWFELKK